MSPADTPMPRGFSVLGLGEIATRCRDLAAMTAFYRDIIGLEVLAHRGRIVFFRLANGVAGHTAVLALFDAGLDPARAVPEIAKSTLHHLALTLAPGEQDAACRWFAANGIPFTIEEFEWIGWRGVFVQDPEGNQVELVAAVLRSSDGTCG